MEHPHTSLVTFQVGTLEYAFRVCDVVEMTHVGHVAPIPRLGEQFAGVTSWRGKTIPVVRLSALLKVEDCPPDVKKRLLVLGQPGPWAALIHRPGRVLHARDFVPVDSAGADEEGHETATGSLVRTEHGLVRVLDARRLLGPTSRRDLGAPDPVFERVG